MFVFDQILPTHVVMSDIRLLSVAYQLFFAYQYKYHLLRLFQNVFFDQILPPHVVISYFRLLSVVYQRFFAYQ